LSGTVFALANTTPVITSLVGPSDPLPLGSGATVIVAYQAIGEPGTQEVRFEWNDGTTTTVVLGVNGSASAIHLYNTPGVFTVRVTVTDANGDSASSVFKYVVVYDPNGGFVTGGGWINSPAGAYALNPGLTGKATFGFNSKYEKGAKVPSGQTQFQFQVASFSFTSTSYDWLVVSGPKAQYKGSGTVNGTGNYEFILTVTDGQVSGGGGVDKFRIKIWDKATGSTIYDNVAGAADDLNNTNPQGIASGSIVIHSQTK
jgi:hypothetical protein